MPSFSNAKDALTLGGGGGGGGANDPPPLDVDAKDGLNDTPLHLALRRGHSRLAACLLEQGGSCAALAAGTHGHTPVHLAASASDANLLRALMARLVMDAEVDGRAASRLLIEVEAPSVDSDTALPRPALESSPQPSRSPSVSSSTTRRGRGKGGSNARRPAFVPMTETRRAVYDCAMARRDDDGRTPLMVACAMGASLATVLALLDDFGADAGALGTKECVAGGGKETPLSLALEAEAGSIAQYLCRQASESPARQLRAIHAAPRSTLLLAFRGAGRPGVGAVLEALMAAEVTRGELRKVFKDEPALANAAGRGDEADDELVPLVGWRSIVHADPASGATAVHAACRAGDVQLLALLLDRMAELAPTPAKYLAALVHPAFIDGSTPLHIAAAALNFDSCEVLLTAIEAGIAFATDEQAPASPLAVASTAAAAGMRDAAGRTAMHLAVLRLEGTALPAAVADTPAAKAGADDGEEGESDEAGDATTAPARQHRARRCGHSCANDGAAKKRSRRALPPWPPHSGGRTSPAPEVRHPGSPSRPPRGRPCSGPCWCSSAITSASRWRHATTQATQRRTWRPRSSRPKASSSQTQPRPSSSLRREAFCCCVYRM
jgi:ankyrin repeat protein